MYRYRPTAPELQLSARVELLEELVGREDRRRAATRGPDPDRTAENYSP